MTEQARGSTVPRRQLGRHLRELRDRAEMTVRAAAKKLERSEATIWRIETGQISLRSIEVEAMCRVYGADERITEALMALAKETKAKGWWHAYGDAIPEWFDVYVGLEEAAEHITTYETHLVPGLLQTEDYARTVVSGNRPDWDSSEIDRRVQFRIARQGLLRRPTAAPTFNAVLHESVLRGVVGGPQIMAAQLDRLTETSQLSNVSLRVVPLSAGFHLGLVTAPFVVLGFPINGSGDASEPPTVYADGFTGALYLDKPAEVERYNQAVDSIRQVALGEAESASLIKKIAEELRQ